MNDIQYVKFSDVKAGMKLQTDRGFTCIGSKHIVIEADDKGELYFKCGSGRHYLDGQLRGSGDLVGLTEVKEVQS